MNSNTLPTARIPSIDVLRGLVIVLMALDHVRDFFGPTSFNPLDLTQTSAGWYVTRYITHFCAPIFVFLAGVSAGLYGRTVSRTALFSFLWTRGLWLVLLECTVVSLSWGALLGGVITLQVIWALGMAMVVLAGAMFLPRPVQIGLALLLILGHNAFDSVHAKELPAWGGLWSLLHEPGFHNLQFVNVFVLYPLVPWVGVMLAGYWVAPYLSGLGQTQSAQGAGKPAHRTLLALAACGLGLWMLMVLLRAGNVYGDPNPWEPQTRGLGFSAMSFLNFAKYPPSLLYLCVTLGGGALLLAGMQAWAGRTAAWLWRGLLVFGKVPMFFYLIHLPVIHVGAQIWSWVRYQQPAAWGLSGASAPVGYEADLGFVYAVWLAYVLALYPVCRWYGEYKRQHPGGWRRYV